jgi:uncharacterized protein
MISGEVAYAASCPCGTGLGSLSSSLGAPNFSVAPHLGEHSAIWISLAWHERTASMKRLWALILVSLFVGSATYTATFLKGFRVEASSEALALEDDPGQETYDKSRAAFGNDEYVFVTVHRDDLFTPQGVKYVKELTDKVAALDGIKSALSMTEIPLFKSTKAPPNLLALRFKGIAGQPKLTHKSVILEKARKELTTSKVYSGSLVSENGKTAAVLATFEVNPTLTKLMDDWVDLKRRIKKASGELLVKLEAEFEVMNPKYREMETQRKDTRIKIVQSLRKVVADERAKGHKVDASGLPMIIIDMVDYIEADLKVFGLASITFLALFLGLIFQRVRWVILPLLTCIGTAIFILGLFVLQDKRTTVVTCNIPSLLLVIGLAHSIHIIVRFREFSNLNPEAELWVNLKAALKSIFIPCFYTALTTGVGFLSLMAAGIRPIIDFGFHMGLGVGLAFALSFIIFPAGLLLFPRIGKTNVKMDMSTRLLTALARLSLRRRFAFIIFSLVILAASLYGCTLITVETRFIDYFRKSSPIYKSLSFIDTELGGTTQFEIILKGDKDNYFKTKEGLAAAQAADAVLQKYKRRKDAKAVDNGVPEESKVVGNIVGLSSVVEECKSIVNAAGMTKANKLFVLNKIVPMLGRDTLSSYVTDDWKQIRVVARIHDTALELDRNVFIGQIQKDLEATVPKTAKIELSGIFILYTNMLNSLTASQFKTGFSVFGLIFLMMLLLLRNVRAALICMIPNALPIVFVLGLMGWLGIHLDMATVMIASISLGIAIDGTIHYTVRFREEYKIDGDASAAVIRSHESIGIAIFYTTLTSIAGFWVLALSNFVPNIYFGIFTGVAMLASLFGALTILPIALAIVKPFKGPDKTPAAEQPAPAEA